MLEIRHLTKKYHDHLILNSISLSFPNTGLFGIVGESGCGKSTFLHLLAGLDTPTSGDILFNGNNIFLDVEAYRQHHCQIVFQHFFLDHDSKVKDHLRISSFFNPKKRKEMEEWMIQFELNDFKNKKISTLSGGQKQRVALLRALSNTPDVLLLDEPTASLNPELATAFMEQIKILSKTCLVIFVSHDINLVQSYCDEVIEMEEGRLPEMNFASVKTYGPLSPSKRLSLKQSFELAYRLLMKNKYRFILSLFSLVLAFTFIFSSDLLKNQIKDLLHLQLSQIFPTSSLSFMYKDRHPMTKEEMNLIEDDRICASFFLMNEYGVEELILNHSTYSIEDYSQVATQQTLLSYGRLPILPNEIVINYPLALKMDKGSNFDNLLNKTVKIKIDKEYDVTIVGITASKTGLDAVLFKQDGLLDLIDQPVNSSLSLLYIDQRYSIEDVKKDLEKTYSELEFKIVGQSYLDKIDETIDQVTLILLFLALFLMISSLLLIGVVMYLNVVEESKFIGILLCLGCKRKDVKFLFLLQGFVLVCISFIMSLGLTMTLMAFVSYFIEMIFSVSTTLSLPLEKGIFLTVCILCFALIASYYPARKASLKNVLDTLKD